jgi:hypothetical protein
VRHFQSFWQLQSQPLKQDGLVLRGTTDAAFSDLHSRSSWQHHFDQLDLAQLREHGPWIISQASMAAHLPERLS